MSIRFVMNDITRPRDFPPKNSSRIRKIRPTRSKRAKYGLIDAGRNSANIRLPSSGGIGIKLNTAKTVLINTLNPSILSKSIRMGLKNVSRQRGIERMSPRKRRPVTMTSIKLAKTPAADTSSVSLGWLRRLLKFTGTGLAQPKITGEPVIISSRGKISDPVISRCFMGFNVNLPASLAVWSPNR